MFFKILHKLKELLCFLENPSRLGNHSALLVLVKVECHQVFSDISLISIVLHFNKE